MKENKINLMGQVPFCNIPIRFKNDQDVFIFNNNNWDYISEHFELSEAFIENNKDKLNWKLICQNQKLTKDIVIKHKDIIDFHDLLHNSKLPFIAYPFAQGIYFDERVLKEKEIKERLDWLDINRPDHGLVWKDALEEWYNYYVNQEGLTTWLENREGLIVYC